MRNLGSSKYTATYFLPSHHKVKHKMPSEFFCISENMDNKGGREPYLGYSILNVCVMHIFWKVYWVSGELKEMTI